MPRPYSDRGRWAKAVAYPPDGFMLFLQNKMTGGPIQMTIDQVNQAYASFVTIMDMIADQGDNVNERMVLEAIDDIINAGFAADEACNLIRCVIDGALTGEIDDDARREVEATRVFLADD